MIGKRINASLPAVAFAFLLGMQIAICTAAQGQTAESKPAHDCPECGNTGKVLCPACRAGRDLWCSECAAKTHCKTCDGLGWVLCPRCGGGDALAERTFMLSLSDEQARIGQAVGTAVRRIETPRFRLINDVDHRKSHLYAQLIEKYAEKFNDTFGRGAAEKMWEEKCDVYLFNSREAFVKFAVIVDGRPEVVSSGGYSCPSPARPLVVLFKESRNDDDTIRAIIHELAHVYLGLFYKNATVPDWVQEGVAQDFEFSYKTETSRRKESVKILKAAIEANRLMSLTELSAMKFSPTEPLPYAASWSAVSFLISTDKKAFVEWVKLMKDGKDQHTAFSAIFAGPMPSANAAWRQYIGRLK